MSRPLMLADRMNGHDNNFGLLRLFAAFLVLFGHSFTLLEATPEKPYPPDPITRYLREMLPFGEGLPGIGVHAFFVISGFLVTRSFLSGGDARRFWSARLLRIVPAYWMSLLVLAFLLGPIVSAFPFAAYLQDPSLWRFLGYDIAFWPMWGALPGVFESLPVSGAVNGPYWTLPLELQMYGWCFLLGIAGVYRKPALFLFFFGTVIAVHGVFGMDPIFFTRQGEPRLWHFFFAGTALCLFAERIPLSGKLFAVLLLLPVPFFIFGGGYFFHLTGAAAFSYGLLYLAYGRYVPAFDPSRYGDFSYGLYLYAFPVQQCLAQFFGRHLNGWTMTLAAFAVTLPIAALSWYLIERPALRFKRLFRCKPAESFL